MLVRSSSIDTFKACPRKAYYVYHKGYIRRGSGNSDLGFGKAVHAGIETFHKTGSMQEALTALGSISYPQTKVKNSRAAIVLLHMYVAANKISMIELETFFEKPFGPHIWRGKVDGRGIYTPDGQLYVVEHKTTNPRFLQFKPNDQFIGYYYFMRQDHPDLAGVFINNLDPERVQIKHSPISFSDLEVAAWEVEMLATLDFYQHCIDTNVFPRNPHSCFAYNKQCSFFELCQDGYAHPAMEEALFEINPEALNLSW